MINSSEILQTIHMFDQQHLDIRTITMGISLLDCADPDPKAACRKVYDKICRRAQNLVATGQTIEKEFGIPIVNKRVSVTPISLVASASDTADYAPLCRRPGQGRQNHRRQLHRRLFRPGAEGRSPRLTESSSRPSPRPWPPPTWCAPR